MECNEVPCLQRRDEKASLTKALIALTAVDMSEIVAKISTHTIQLALLIPSPSLTQTLLALSPMCVMTILKQLRNLQHTFSLIHLYARHTQTLLVLTPVTLRADMCDSKAWWNCDEICRIVMYMRACCSCCRYC